jgi:hypothetical protein
VPDRIMLFWLHDRSLTKPGREASGLTPCIHSASLHQPRLGERPTAVGGFRSRQLNRLVDALPAEPPH